MVGHGEDGESGGEMLKVTWQLVTRWQNMGGHSHGCFHSSSAQMMLNTLVPRTNQEGSEPAELFM